MQRPKAITGTAVLAAILNTVGFLNLAWHAPHRQGLILVCSVLLVLAYLVEWFFWTGYNWARLLVMLSSVLSLGNFYRFRFHAPPNLRTPTQTSLFVVEALLSVFLLWYLNTREVKRWYGVRQASQSL